MTEEQIKTWRKHRDIAKKIEDPVQRQIALDKLYEEKDDLMQDCFYKQSKRIKEVVAMQEDLQKDLKQSKEKLTDIDSSMNEMKFGINVIKEKLQKNDDITYRLNEHAIEVKGMKKAIKLIWIIATSGGAGILIWLIKMVSQ